LFSGILIECFAVLLLIHLVAQFRYLFFLGYLVLFAYVGINFLQIVSFEVSSDFVTKLALGNVEFAGLLMTTENISIVVICFLLFVVTPLIVAKGLIKWGLITGKPPKHKPQLRALLLFAVGVILFAVLINNAKYWMPEEAIAQYAKLLRKNTIKRLKPVDQFIKLFKKQPVNDIFPVFSAEDIKELRNYGFPIATDKRFPLLRKKIYDSPPPFARKQSQNPNVILIFAEGFSARTASVYSQTYPDLTPNLQDFSQDSMVISNYYNHTAATYRGLHGGLCSLFPKFGAMGGWLDSFEDIPKTNYLCLTDIFAQSGYRNFYLDPHFTDTSGLDEMMYQLKFDEVLNAEHLLKDYLGGEESLRPSWLTDLQMYRSLVSLLENRDQEEPFFLTMYSVETHAWVDVVEDGIEYQNGERNVLNTIHNMDKAFGHFWNYYKNSNYANNTIIIFTSDHGHYYSNPYLKLMKAYEEVNYQKLFIDKIPMIIHDPTATLPPTFDANNATSIDLAPSLAHMLELPNGRNSFLGSSIFEPRTKENQKLGIASYGESTYIIDGEKINDENNSDTHLQQLDLIGRYIKYIQALEVTNRIYP